LRLTQGERPLLALDAGAYAFYLDSQSRRPDHIAARLDKPLDRSIAEKYLDSF
jgi:superoxide dismutase